MNSNLPKSLKIHPKGLNSLPNGTKLSKVMPTPSKFCQRQNSHKFRRTDIVH